MGEAEEDKMWCFYPSPVSSISIMSRPGWVLGGAEEMRVRRKTVNHFSQLLGKQLAHQLTHLCSNQSDLQTTLTTPRSNESSSHTTTYRCALAHQKNGKSLAKYFSILRTLTARGKGGAKIDSDLNKDYKNYFS